MQVDAWQDQKVQDTEPQRKSFIAGGTKYTLLFLCLSFAGILFLFRGALWNDSILAPLDIGPTMYPEWKWLDPSAGDIPQNHYLIDIFDFELPRHYAFYKTLKGGEIPWWLPQIAGGQPLLAESYTSATDPFRLLLNSFCSFETGYNWIRALHSFLLGVGAFTLLKYLRFRPVTALFGGLAFQFASSHTLFFYPDHLEATFLYYPFLWLIWDSWLMKPTSTKFIASVLACFGVFVAGNQQSAVYLPIFGFCFLVGYGWRSMASWKSSLVLIVSSIFIAALLAAPLLLPEMEMLLLGQRELKPYQVKSVLTGPLSLSFIFPWVLGTFKTLDLSKIADQMALGFALYPGTVAALLALFGCTIVIRRKRWTGPVRTAMALVCFYLILICCTPLLKWLYIRASDLALLGFIVFASIGVEEIIAKAPAASRFMKRSFFIITCIVAAMHLFAFVIYPKIQAKVENYVLKRDQQNPSLETASELRRAQIASLPREITFQNAGMLAAWLGAGMLMIVGTKVPRKVEFAVFVLTVINILPLLHFGFRFIPRAPIESWHAVLQGGPEIQTARKLVGDSLRFAETDPGRRFNLIPGNTAIYYGIHTLVGYTGLPLFPNGKEFAKREANFVYNNKRVTGADGEFLSPNPDKNVRFIWKNASTRLVQITKETMNTITLKIAAGPAGTLIRTDTYYPGWDIVEPTNCKWGRDSSGYFAIEVSPNATEVTLAYSPRGLKTAVWVSLGGLLLLSLGAVTIPKMSMPQSNPKVS